MRGNNKYWLIQFMGWGFYMLLNLYIVFLSEHLNWKIISVNLLLALGGIFITDIYRNIVNKNEWHSMPTTELLFRVLLVNILTAFIFCLWHFLLIQLMGLDIGPTASYRLLFKPFIAAYMIFITWNMIYFAWSYIERNRRQMIDQLQMQNDLQELELKSMRSNLQPHFIFNALNSVRALVHEDPQGARDAVSKLSNILRTTISTKEDSIPLHQEIEVVQDYLHLEKIRFEERLNYNILISPETKDVNIPPMLLQNMVENAVKHGISIREEGGTINIKSYWEGNSIKIEISNEGQINEENKLKGTGFGMSSSLKRLHHLYPENSDILMFEKDAKVFVQISIPFKKKMYEN